MFIYLFDIVAHFIIVPFNLFELFLNSGKSMYAEALKDAEQCVKLNKRWGKGYYRKAVALLGLSRAVEAEAVLKEGLTVDPNNSDIRAKLTEVSAKVKDLMKFTAPDGTPLTGAALVKAEGNDHFKNGRTEQAIACYSRAIELSSDPKERSIIYSNRAACWSQQQNWHGMLEDANLAVQEDDTNVKAYIRRALAYEGLEKYKLAIADFKKVLELDPNAMIASKGIARLSKFTY